jgi:hypothetical protein
LLRVGIFEVQKRKAMKKATKAMRKVMKAMKATGNVEKRTVWRQMCQERLTPGQKEYEAI